ncbi:MAG: zinc-dependent alcohol dehydrogenase, partial [Betaproteobacteria bacterium]
EFGQPLSFESLAVPTPGPDEVLIQVEVCGVCHSDLHIVDGDLPGFRLATKPRLVPGHEVIGRVVRRGEAVSNLALGERVGVAWLHSACGSCEQCLEGRENLCRKGVVTGMMVDGGYAEFMCAKANHALHVPDALSSASAAPLFCAGLTVYRALMNSQVSPGQRVAIFGVGGLGHLAVQIVQALGAEAIALDIGAEKLALARELGAVAALDVTDPETPKALRKLGGMHVAIVTSAAKAAYELAMKCLRPAGTMAIVGLPSEAIPINALSFVGSELRIVSAAVGTRDDMRAVLKLAAEGKLHCHIEEVPLADANAVFERMRRGQINGRMVLRCCA